MKSIIFSVLTWGTKFLKRSSVQEKALRLVRGLASSLIIMRFLKTGKKDFDVKVPALKKELREIGSKTENKSGNVS